MSNDRDQEIVRSAISDTGSGLLEFLPALGAREAIAFGDGVTLPVRIKFHELPPEALPKSSSAKFSEKWQTASDDIDLIKMVVERWRASGHVELSETLQDGGYTTHPEPSVEQVASPAAAQDDGLGASHYPMAGAEEEPQAMPDQSVIVEEAAESPEIQPRLGRPEPTGNSGTEEGLRARLMRRQSAILKAD
jgi:hypothetical protein